MQEQQNTFPEKTGLTYGSTAGILQVSHKSSGGGGCLMKSKGGGGGGRESNKSERKRGRGGIKDTCIRIQR